MKSKNRMTLEELKELNPTYENPVELTCDDGSFDSDMASIAIIAIHDTEMAFMDAFGALVTNSITVLTHYPSKKKEPTTEILYECISNYGVAAYFFEDGSYPMFHSRKKEGDRVDLPLKRKTGRTLLLNMDTWDLISE